MDIKGLKELTAKLDKSYRKLTEKIDSFSDSSGIIFDTSAKFPDTDSSFTKIKIQVLVIIKTITEFKDSERFFILPPSDITKLDHYIKALNNSIDKLSNDIVKYSRDIFSFDYELSYMCISII